MMADKQKVSRLVKTARGQLDGILKMIEDDRYCMDISTQLLAAASLIKKAQGEVMRAHLSHCVHDTLLAGDKEATKDKIDEILKILEKNM